MENIEEKIENKQIEEEKIENNNIPLPPPPPPLFQINSRENKENEPLEFNNETIQNIKGRLKQTTRIEKKESLEFDFDSIIKNKLKERTNRQLNKLGGDLIELKDQIKEELKNICVKFFFFFIF